MKAFVFVHLLPCLYLNYGTGILIGSWFWRVEEQWCQSLFKSQYNQGQPWFQSTESLTLSVTHSSAVAIGRECSRLGQGCPALWSWPDGPLMVWWVLGQEGSWRAVRWVWGRRSCREGLLDYDSSWNREVANLILFLAGTETQSRPS